ncbi:MAG: hypothetical protein N2557_00775 [Hydrogenophilus sp.]|nr:hypothetical protein [Hydrogenophilus sp.]
MADLILPGALWPNPTSLSAPSPTLYPTLARWLGRRRFRTLPLSYQEILAFYLGSPSTPIARLRFLGEDLPPAVAGDSSGATLCADPITLVPTREGLILLELGETAPPLPEMETTLPHLYPILTRHLGPTISLTFTASNRGYLRGIPPQLLVDTHFTPLPAASGRPLAAVVPSGRHARLWLRLFNDLSIALTHHPLNRARQDRHLPSLNALWLWGETTPTPPSLRPFRPSSPTQILISSEADPLLKGWLRLRALPHQILPTAPPRLPPRSLILLDLLAEPARRLDLPRWQMLLLHLETCWFSHLPAPRTLLLPAERATLLGRPTLWAFRSSPRSLHELLPSSSG